MTNPQKRPFATSRSICVVEVTRDRYEPPTWFQCIISVPGRPSAFTRTWQATEWPLDMVQALDLTAWVEKTVLNALETSVGIQGVLET